MAGMVGAGMVGFATKNATRGLRQVLRQASASSSAAPPGVPAPLEEEEMLPEFRNVDGERIEDGRYASLKQAARGILGNEARIIDGIEDPVRAYAYGTAACFYRLEPKLVLKVEKESEVQQLLPEAARLRTPVTFRAAGTSLSGQAVTDSVLVKLSHNGKNFRKHEIKDGGKIITVEPGLIGGEVNRLLASYAKKNKTSEQYKIGPDPASIDSCMIGGIVSNNSSGMCCGVKQNTYNTLKDMRIVFVDGTVLDTSDASSRESFLKTHAHVVTKVQDLARRVQADEQLTALIKKKFSIKCTTGYAINALVDHPINDPIEIIKRLMIGSEGTLGFISQVTYNTVVDHPYKASCFIMYKDVMSACVGASELRSKTSVDAVELFDNASLWQSQNPDMLSLVKGLDDLDKEAASLLIECRGATPEELQASIDEVTGVLRDANLNMYKSNALSDYPFLHDPKEYMAFWNMRKGLIPHVGGSRQTGTSMLIEDVAVEVDKLGPLTVDLIDMFQRHGYDDAACFGHALEGNLHLVFSQGFRNDEEVERYSRMMEELCEIVAIKYGGSLKAEHGTGRNMAPFVEMEWGTKATEIMWELKEIFDPNYILNPGVILNHDPDVHKKALKLSPPANSIVDKCIECGFCESNCPSKDFSLTPRQRITVYREMQRLEALPMRTDVESKRLVEFKKLFEYLGNATCAADGMCQEKCPVSINTGELIKHFRKEEMLKDLNSNKLAAWMANNFGMLSGTIPTFLNVVSGFHSILGQYPLQTISNALNGVSGQFIPVWNPYMPQGASSVREPKAPAQIDGKTKRKVVYLPSCVTRMMGPASGDSERDSVHTKMMNIMEKAGYEVIIPESMSSQCCGMMFDTRGLNGAAKAKSADMVDALLEASEDGKLPVVIDTSPCLSTLKNSLEPGNPLKFALYEPVEFISNFCADRLEFSQVKDSIAIHVPCSSKKMKIEDSFMKLASKCAKEVHPSGIPCCGMAGDRGMRYPELTGSSLQNLAIPQGCTDGYSTSRTCEMSLSNHSGMHFRGLVYLVDEATKPKSKQEINA